MCSVVWPAFVFKRVSRRGFFFVVVVRFASMALLLARLKTLIFLPTTMIQRRLLNL